MKSAPKKPKPVSAESIAHLADRGKDVSRFFTNSGKMMPRVNVDSLPKLEDATQEW